MKLSATLIGNLDFSEAITMVTLIERTQYSMEQASDDGMPIHHNAILKLGDWHCVYTITHAGHHGQSETWSLILQSGNSAHFAVVCGLAVDSLPLNQFSGEMFWNSLQEWMGNQSVPYKLAGPQGSSQPEEAKVFRPWLVASQRVQDEIDIFFRALSGLKFVQYHIDQAALITPTQQKTYLAAIEAALQLRFGAENSQSIVEAVGKCVAGASDGNEASSLSIPTELFETEQALHPLWQMPEAGFTATFAGHSTGGAVAPLVALEMKRSWEAHLDFPLFHCQIYTFGSPKVGNQPFVDAFNRMLPDCCHRVQNLMDTLTYGPLDEFSFPNPAIRALPNPLSLRLPDMDPLNLQERLGIRSTLDRMGLSQMNDNWILYQHIGIPFLHPGVGNAPTKLNFPFGIKPPAMAFEHDPAGYKEMLLDAQSRYEAMSKPVDEMAKRIEEGREWLSNAVRLGTLQAQSLFNAFQDRMADR
ncbi:MAG: hypothetical protein AAF702_03985 [Chloroflexota bacterium]